MNDVALLESSPKSRVGGSFELITFYNKSTVLYLTTKQQYNLCLR